MEKAENPLNKLKQLYNNASGISIKLGIDRQIVEGWFKRGRIPFRRGSMIDEKTSGEVTKESVWLWANKSFKDY